MIDIKNKRNVLIAISMSLILYGVFLRLQGLGYSNFQGDEVNTIDFYNRPDFDLLDYLFSQKKGPIQFLINFINLSIFGYINEFQIRLPYALFGIAGIFTWFLLAKKFFELGTALATGILISLNGLFISFSRITQYQSVMYFLMPIAIFSFIFAIEKKKSLFFIISGFLSGLLLLTHYDGASILAFFFTAMFILLRNIYYDNKKIDRNMLWGFVLFIFSFAFINAVFYIPYLFGNNYFEDSTKGYLSSRLLGGGFMPRTEISLKLLSMYVPKEWLISMFVLSISGVIFAHFNNFDNKIKYWRYAKILFLILSLVLVFSTWFSLYPIKPRSASGLFILSSIGISILLLIYSKSSWKNIGLTVWFLASFSFYFYVVRDPRTHVYIALLPGLVFVGYAINTIRLMFFRAKLVGELIFYIVSIIFIGFICGYYWAIYVNKSPEYPWWDKTYLGKNIYHISESNRIDGVFGFNNYRGWETIGDYYKRGCLTGSYESNEKDNITSFYIGFKQLEGDSWSNENGADTMIIVEGPHSWIYVKRREFSGYKLIDTIKSQAVDVTYIYGKNSVYKEGEFLCIN